MLNRLMRAPALRPKRLSRRQRVVDAQQHDVHAVYRRPQHSEDDDDLTRFTLFGEESPFIGAGELVYQWNPPMCLQLLRPGDEKTPLHEREYLEPPFEAYELVDHLREAVEQLDTDTGTFDSPRGPDTESISPKPTSPQIETSYHPESRRLIFAASSTPRDANSTTFSKSPPPSKGRSSSRSCCCM